MIAGLQGGTVSIQRELFDTIVPALHDSWNVCRHTYCSNMARAGMHTKPLQYLMGPSDIGVPMNKYTHLGL